MASHEDNKDLVRRYWEDVFGKRELHVADEIVASDCKVKSANGSTMIMDGRESMKKFIDLMHGALTNMQVTIHDQIAEEDKVVTRWTVTGVMNYENKILNMAPIGQRMVAQGISVSRVSDGTIKEIAQTFERSLEPPSDVEFNIHHWLWS
jgi:predicted ester cyclase